MRVARLAPRPAVLVIQPPPSWASPGLVPSCHMTIWGMSATLALADPARIPAALAVLSELVHDVDDAANRFRPDSEVSRLNETGHLGELSATMLDLLALNRIAFELTSGACDPTILPALLAAGYDRDIADLPPSLDPMAVERDVPAIPASGMKAVTVDVLARSATLGPGCRIDLGALAKAYLVDRAVEALGPDVLVEVGGDVAARGAGPDGPWVVAVSPVLVVDGTEPRVALRDGALATSSIARAWVGAHHIIDPRTGRPSRTPYAAATVAAPTCSVANAFSTAALVMESPDYHLAQADLSARLVRRDGVVELVGAWPRDCT